MKFKIYAVLLGTLIMLGSCAKPKNEVNLLETDLLSRDNDFKALLNQEQGLMVFIQNLANSKQLSLNALQLKLASLHEIDLNLGNDDKSINDFLGEVNVNYLKKYANNYAEKWQKLNVKYDYIPIQKIDEACKQIYTQQYNGTYITKSDSVKISTNSILKGNMIDNCGWRYYLCMAASVSVGITCHASCIGMTAGLGTPVCLLTCGSIEAAAGVACIDNYCPFPQN